jgi:flagellin
VTSVKSSASVAVALTNLRAIGRDLDTTSRRVSTGFRIGAASDGAAYWAIATSLRTDNGSLDALRGSLGLVKTSIDVTARKMDRVIDQLGVVGKTLVSAMDGQMDTTVLQDQIQTALASIRSISNDASGMNWLSADTRSPGFDATTNLMLGFTRQGGITVPITKALDTSRFILFDERPREGGYSYFSPVPAAGSLGTVLKDIAAEASASQPDGYHVATWDGLSTRGTEHLYLTWNYGLLDTQFYVSDGPQAKTPFSISSIDLTTSAADGKMVKAFAAIVDATRAKLLDAASTLGATSALLSSREEFTRRLMDVNASAIGTLVDADIEEEAVRLKALQVQREMALQALNVSNGAKQMILALFRP